VRKLPHLITDVAFRASNGELAWKREHIEQALLAIQDTQQAILGGEVWRITGLDTWDGLIPQRGDNKPAVWSWNTAPRSSSESWVVYCGRTVTESMNAVRSMAVEQATQPEFVSQLRFNVTYVEETSR
jgi:hypothetical protein